MHTPTPPSLPTALITAAERREFLAAVRCLKAAAGLPLDYERPIRELLREDSFETDLACALGSNILETWPLKEQLEFLEAIAPLSDAAKSVRIYSQVYSLYRANRKPGGKIHR